MKKNKNLVNLKNVALLASLFGLSTLLTGCYNNCCNDCNKEYVPVNTTTNTVNITINGDNNIVGDDNDGNYVYGGEVVTPQPKPNPKKPKPEDKPVVNPENDCDCEEIVTKITYEHIINEYGERPTANTTYTRAFGERGM